MAVSRLIRRFKCWLALPAMVFVCLTPSSTLELCGATKPPPPRKPAAAKPAPKKTIPPKPKANSSVKANASPSRKNSPVIKKTSGKRSQAKSGLLRKSTHSKATRPKKQVSREREREVNQAKQRIEAAARKIKSKGLENRGFKPPSGSRVIPGQAPVKWRVRPTYVKKTIVDKRTGEKRKIQKPTHGVSFVKPGSTRQSRTEVRIMPGQKSGYQKSPYIRFKHRGHYLKKDGKQAQSKKKDVNKKLTHHSVKDINSAKRKREYAAMWKAIRSD